MSIKEQVWDDIWNTLECRGFRADWYSIGKHLNFVHKYHDGRRYTWDKINIPVWTTIKQHVGGSVEERFMGQFK
jgi:hypothetical protein